VSPPDDPKTEPIARLTPAQPETPAACEPPSLERRRPRLVSIHGAQLGKRWELAPCGVVIGRDPKQAGIALGDASISARHCALELDPVSDEFSVSDLGSRNGTFVNGEKIRERRLADGDRIFVGETVLEFTLDDALGAGFHSGIDGRLDIDALTGLLVKRAFDLELARAFALAASGAGPLSVLMMDLDTQRSPDDGRVLKLGALCIAEVGKIIREEVSSAGCACRFAGDDFLALLHPLDTTRGLLLAERIRARVAAYAFERDGAQTNPTISIGIAELHPGLPTLDHLLQAADEALYRAKCAGRNQVSR
jgi:diguanylate cyclase (GGDEF)-like protein